MKIKYYWDSSRCGDTERSVLDILEDREDAETIDICDWGDEKIRDFYLDEVVSNVSDEGAMLRRAEGGSGEEINALQAGLSILGIGVLLSDGEVYIGDDALDFAQSL